MSKDEHDYESPLPIEDMMKIVRLVSNGNFIVTQLNKNPIRIRKINANLLSSVDE